MAAERNFNDCPTEVSLTFNKPTDVRKPVSVSLAVEIEGIGRVDLDFDEHEFARLLSGSQIEAVSGWRYEV